MRQATNYCGAYETAYHALVACGDLRADETVLIHGATGAGGVAAVQIAAAIGAKVILTGGDDDKLAIAAAQGRLSSAAGGDGGAVIGVHNYRTETDGFRAQVKELTGGRGVDVVYDSVGGAVSLETLRCVAFGARYCVVGWTSTPFAGGGRGAGAQQQSANALPTNLIMMKGVHVIGCPVAIHTRLDPSIRERRVADLDAWARDGKLVPFFSHTFPLAEARAALLAKWNREITGGCVVNPPACDWREAFSSDDDA